MIPVLRSLEKVPIKGFDRSPQSGVLAFLGGMTIVLVVAYVLSERTFYWWDYTTYSWILEKKLTEFQNSPLQALRTTWRSAGSDYSDYPVLLLLPFRWAFGNGRVTYILSVALVYLLPFAWVVGTIATQLIPAAPPRTVRWIAAWMTIAMPMFWLPTLRGYVDIGAALGMAIATWIYLRDVELRSRWQIVTIGLLLGFTPLFRRHFAYGVIAFFGAMTVTLLVGAATSGRGWRAIGQSVIRLAGVAIVGAITLITFGKHFLRVVLHNDFSSLYTSYEVSLSQGLQYYGIAYGWVVWLLAGLGFAIGFRKRFLSHSTAGFLILFYGFLFIVWVSRVKQVGVHYTTHFTALIIFGLVSFTWALLQARSRTVPLVVLGLFLCCNIWIGLAPVSFLDSTLLRPTRLGMTLLPEVVGTKFSELFAANNPPLRRSDYDELARLVQTLRTIASQKPPPIYVGAASSLLNSNLLGFVEDALYGHRSLNLLPAEDIDSRDRYPIEQMLQADYLVTATPFQHQIRPEDQEIVKLIGDIFDDRWQISQDFSRLPPEFRLANQVRVNLYRRVRSTSLATALNTLAAMKNAVGSRPGRQLDWVAIEPAPHHDLWREAGRLFGTIALLLCAHTHHAHPCHHFSVYAPSARSPDGERSHCLQPVSVPWCRADTAGDRRPGSRHPNRQTCPCSYVSSYIFIANLHPKGNGLNARNPR
ncbi:MAG: hypothetical protein HC780_12300 [Leptolyngbyaceae cyanobacterium CSU_1_3]|nr:hypothetical protein [Leptolyngbyaceae cyanobacterium CSU_1_3]